MMPGRPLTGRLASSFRDPSGFLFHRDGVLYRQVEPSYQEAYERLMGESGLYQALVDEGLLIPHEEVSPSLAASPLAHRVLRPEPVGFISYPYSWCFSQLRDAALTTLRIARASLERGMIMKDASAYNIQFHRGQPVLVDTLSFEPYVAGEPWVAYRQFCQHFLAPLLLMSRIDVRLSGLLRTHLDGVPLDLASALLPAWSWLQFSTVLHVHLHARSIRRHSGDTAEAVERGKRSGVSLKGLLGLMDNLEAAVKKLEWRAEGTEWADYEREHNYGERGMEEKRQIVGEMLRSTAPKTVWDLGANTGEFSRLAAELGASVVSFDVDPAAVERSYLRVRERGDPSVLPLVMDLTNPDPAQGWAHRERESLEERGPVDALLALALIHHLSISNNVPLGDVASFFSRLAPSLIIEFVPKSDPQVERLLVSRRDVFSTYDRESFEREFARYYRITEAVAVGETGRTLYRMARC
jgi:ribosomal protein L11 methylase PrmA